MFKIICQCGNEAKLEDRSHPSNIKLDAKEFSNEFGDNWKFVYITCILCERKIRVWS